MDAPAPPRQPTLAILSHIPNFVAALGAAFTVYVIPRFAAIYRDMLGSEPLPPLTLFVLRLQPLWMLLAVAFVLTALYLAWHSRFSSPPAAASVALLLFASAQVGLILIALFLPLCGMIIRAKPTDPVNQAAK